MKKAFKIVGIILLVLIVVLIAAPFVFESQLKDLLKKTINENVNATVEFSDLDLSFFRSFPQATLVLSDLSVINKAPFEGDTLAISEETILEMSIKELFKGSDQPKKIDQLILNNAYVNIKVDSLGNANYDIAIEDTTATATDTAATAFSLDLEHYEINNSRLKYLDEGQKLSLLLEDLNHQGTGDFSLDQSKLETKTRSFVTFDLDGTNFLRRNKVALDAVIQMDLENMRYTFLENQAMINQLPLKFDGYVQVNENNNEIDLTFKTPSSDFKNFLAVIPEEYAKNIENVQTSGDFVVNGMIKGIVDELHIPKLDVSVTSNNASFKYPDLPKSVEDINLDLRILNTTGLADDTYMTFENVTFRIDRDVFAANGSVKNLTGNMLVDMALKGTINLANIEKAYPLELEQELNGILTADVTTSFDMNSIEQERYENVNSSGTANIKDFSYSSPEIPNEVKIANADLNFNQGNVRVPQLILTTGQSDLQATGNIENLMGFLFKDQSLKGSFNVNSNTFSVNDFMVAEAPVEEGTTPEETPTEPNTTATPTEAVKIPSFLDAQLDFAVKKVLYDDLVLNNAKGTLLIQNETATLKGISANIFDGNIGLNGNVSTQGAVPTFDMKLDLNAMDIAKSFTGLDLLKGLAPIATALEGKLQTQLNLKGDLNKDLTPLLTSIAGDAFAQILTAEVKPEQLALLSRLDEQLNFIDLNDINLDNLKGYVTFKDGAVLVQPFDFNVKGINVNVAGGHSFDMSMNYNLTLDVPAQMLGSQIGSALGKLSGEDIKNMVVALPIGLKGQFQNPQININMEQAVSSLTQRIVEKQKENLKEKGTDAARDILGGILNRQGQKQNPADTTARRDTLQTKTPPVTQKTETQVKDAATSILNGLLGGKKKAQDTTRMNN
ncbi:AsmA-like C-terminal region-containing protein [Antarcticibacterium sp. 1MA-6-2]|uniref:AsmA-like C-terminal region-containing protein n=1 Tax=Antarcticibacterium sp. 1MA-6-2 TaxID=2908210 RepID=UPI001F193113|nr:AsmA-like C-terminal region-containing protein [Antarcticibacterium sp. 1MA-6-2]UJH91025.1 AsmA-like C-terminal region-containing protein [Antarcticibacterium sp. 1MA-6-2]